MKRDEEKDPSYPPIGDSIISAWRRKFRRIFSDLMPPNVKNPKILFEGPYCYINAEIYNPRSSNTSAITVATFASVPMSGCHGILICYSGFVESRFRSRGIGKMIQDIRIEAARDSGFSCLLCTTVDTNYRQHAILEAKGWRRKDQFLNIKTNNSVVIWELILNEVEDTRVADCQTGWVVV